MVAIPWHASAICVVTRWAHEAEYEGLKAALEGALAGQVLPGVSAAPGKTLVEDSRSMPSQARLEVFLQCMQV